jgi:membrane protein DedA with SNARE-associated domain
MSMAPLLYVLVFLAGLVIGYGIGRWHGINLTDRVWTQALVRVNALRAAKEERA